MAEPAQKTEPTVEERVTALTKELDEERRARKVLEDTLGALRTERPAEPRREQPAEERTSFATGVSVQSLNRLKARLGWNDQDVQQHWQIIEAFLGEMAGPILQRADQLFRAAGDTLDRHDALLSIPEYKDLADDVEKEQRARIERGAETLSRKELFHMVRARNFPQAVEKAAKAELEQQRQRTAEAESAATGADAGTTGNARPTPQQTGAKKAPTDAELAGMSREERMQKLTDTLGDATF